MEASLVKTTVVSDGKIELSDIPFADGQEVRVTLEALPETPIKPFTVKDLLDSGTFGMWADRDDIDDPVEFIRRIREREEPEPTDFL